MLIVTVEEVVQKRSGGVMASNMRKVEVSKDNAGDSCVGV